MDIEEQLPGLDIGVTFCLWIVSYAYDLVVGRKLDGNTVRIMPFPWWELDQYFSVERVRNVAFMLSASGLFVVGKGGTSFSITTIQ